MSNQAQSFIAGLRPATPDEAASAKAAAVLAGAAPLSQAALKPGQPPLSPGSPKERWPVKVGTDADVTKVNNAVIVDTTVAELGALPRPPGWQQDPKGDPPLALLDGRMVPTETTVWRVKAQIIAFRLEADGDFHVELKTADGAMNVEIPLPKPPFVPATSIFAKNISDSRQAFINAFAAPVAATSFAPAPSGILADVAMLPPEQLVAAATEKIDLNQAFDSDQVHPFVMTVPPRATTVTGVAFFDKDHGQANNSPNIIELHPVLDIAIV